MQGEREVKTPLHRPGQASKKDNTETVGRDGGQNPTRITSKQVVVGEGGRWRRQTGGPLAGMSTRWGWNAPEQSLDPSHP